MKLLRVQLIVLFLLISTNTFSQEWTWKSPTPVGNDYYNIQVFQGNPIIVGAGGMIVRGDSNNDFTNQLIDGNEGTIIKDITYLTEDLGFAILERINPYYKSRIMKTIDGGETWYSVFEELVGAPRTIEFKNATTGFVGTSGGHIYKTSDKGENWEFDQTLTTINDIKFIDEDTGFIAATSFVYKTTNGGVSWTGYNNQNSVPFYEVDFIDPNTGWVTVMSGVFKTENGGTSWEFTELDDNGRFEDIEFFDIDNGIAIGTISNGQPMIYTSSDGGESWLKVETEILERGAISITREMV